jgi:hypothetical protein
VLRTSDIEFLRLELLPKNNSIFELRLNIGAVGMTNSQQNYSRIYLDHSLFQNEIRIGTIFICLNDGETGLGNWIIGKALDRLAV